MTLSVGNQAARCTWVSLRFSSWSFNFSFRRCLLAHYIQLKFTGSTDVFKCCQYAFIICNKLCVDISWPFRSQDFHMNSSVCHTFLNLLVLIIWCQIKQSPYLPLFSFNTCSLASNILILWRENTYWSLTWGVQKQNMGTYILWTFLHFNIILSLGSNKNIFERLEMTGHSPARS